MRRGAVAVAVAALTLLIGACDSGGGAPMPEASPSSTATPDGEPLATPAGTGVLVAPTPPVRPPTPVPGAPLPADYGALSIDPVSGEQVTVYLGDPDDRFWYANLYPALTADGAGLWVSLRDGPDAIRYDLEGGVTGAVQGADYDGHAWDVLETPDGSTLVFSVMRQVGNQWESRLYLRTGSTAHALPLGSCCASLAPDGVVAYLGTPDVETSRRPFEVFDPASGETTRVTDEVERPGKDGVIRPHWSPSGRFVTTSDVRVAFSDGSVTSTVTYHLHDTVTGASWTMEPAGWYRGPEGQDWLGRQDGTDFVLVHPLTDDVQRRFSSPGESVLGGRETENYLIALVERDGAERETIAFDLRSGQEVERWPGTAHVVETEEGLASVWVEADFGGRLCQAIHVQHPRRDMTLECTGEAGMRIEWSPTGRFLVLYPSRPGEPRYPEVIDMATGATLVIEYQEVVIHWSADDERIVATWGGGL